MNRMRNLIFLFLAMAVSACCAQKQAVNPKEVPSSPNFSNGILKDGTLYVSGQVGRGPGGKRPEAFEDEVKAALDSIGAVLKEAGMGFENAVAVQVYLTDMDLFSKMNSVYVTVFPEPRPARTTVGVARLVGNFRIEITVTAKK